MTSRILAIFLLAALVTSACASGASAPAETQVLPQPNPQPAPVETAAVAPNGKGEFEATDPTTVNLALGKPQFVEFFAFW